MRKRSSKNLRDLNQVAKAVVEAVAVEAEVMPDGKNPAAVALGRLGGKKGGPARAAKLSAEVRSEIARKAARARWAKGAD